MYILWDHVTLRLQTSALYLTNYITSKGKWLHQILFRGFIAKDIQYIQYICTYYFSIFYFVNFFKTRYYFYFTSPIWTILCMSITWNPNKSIFKLHVVMQQNRKNKGDEYFYNALYAVGTEEDWGLLRSLLRNTWCCVDFFFLDALLPCCVSPPLTPNRVARDYRSGIVHNPNFNSISLFFSLTHTPHKQAHNSF